MDKPFHQWHPMTNDQALSTMTNHQILATMRNYCSHAPSQPFHPYHPWRNTALKFPKQTILPKPSMTKHLTNSTHVQPFHPFHSWQTISIMLPMKNHCIIIPHDKQVDQCYHEKPLKPGMSSEIDRWLSVISTHVMKIMSLWQTVATMPPSWSIPSTPQWQTILRSTSIMNRFTHSTHDEPFHPCYKWQTISTMLLITNHCTNVLMTINQQTHPFHGKSLQTCHHHKPFQPSHLRQTISPFHVWQTISPKLPTINHFGFAIHEKLFPPIKHMKKN